MGIIKDLFKGDKVIWIIFLCFCFISIVEVFSATSTLTYSTGNHLQPIKNHSYFLMGGLVIALITHRIPCVLFQILAYIIYPLAFILLSVVLVMEKINGASRWIEILGVSFQPSEFGKMAVVLATAVILSRLRDEKGATVKAFKYLLVIDGIIVCLIFPENFSTSIILSAVVFAMMIIGEIPWKVLIKLGAGCSILVLLTIGIISIVPVEKLSQNMVTHRIETWQRRIRDFNEDKKAVPAAKYDVQNNSQIAHANIAIASSHIIGKLPGNSVQRDFLPQAYSDFIFAIILEELGLLGGVFVVILYIWLLMRIGKIARRIAKHSGKLFPAYLIMGIGILFVLQAMVNMMVSVGLFPVTGQPLPLISRGGTSILMNCIYIGMILSASRYAQEKEEESKEKEMLTNELSPKEEIELLLAKVKDADINSEEELIKEPF
ncbi:MAG: FtsW/RodA/SpoVE family cell cycle protein [Phocaeicola sp.]